MTDAVGIVEEMGHAERRGEDPLDFVRRRYFADPVRMTHVPAMDSDGPVSRVQLVDLLLDEQRAFRSVIPDFRQELTIEVIDSGLRCRVRWHGAMTDGTPIDIPITFTFLVADGVITEMISEPDPVGYEALIRVLTESGFAQKMQAHRSAQLPA